MSKYLESTDEKILNIIRGILLVKEECTSREICFYLNRKGNGLGKAGVTQVYITRLLKQYPHRFGKNKSLWNLRSN